MLELRRFIANVSKFDVFLIIILLTKDVNLSSFWIFLVFVRIFLELRLENLFDFLKYPEKSFWSHTAHLSTFAEIAECASRWDERF